MGFALRSLLRIPRCQPHYCGVLNPLTVSTRFAPAPVKATAGFRVRSSWAFAVRVPSRLSTCLVCSSTPDASLGFPLQGWHTLALPGFRPVAPLTRFAGKNRKTRSCRRLSVSLGHRWVPPLVVRATHRRHDPLGVFAPVRSRSFGRVPSIRGYEFT